VTLFTGPNGAGPSKIFVLLSRKSADLLALGGPSAISALQAFKHMNYNSAFRFHDRFEKRESSCAEAAVMV